MYVSEIEGQSRRAKPLGRWKDRVKEYVCERNASRGGVLEQARMKCLERERWRLFAMTSPLGDVPRGSEASEL